MASHREKLVRWFRRQLAKEGLFKFVLRHAAGKTANVAEFPFDATSTPEDFATMVAIAAKDDADGLGGTHTYSLASYYNDRPEMPVERCSFREFSEPVEGEDSDLSTEPADKNGLLAQLMRHNEANARTTVLAFDGVMRHMSKTLESAMTRNSELEERHFLAMTTMEEMASLRHERDMDTLKVAGDQKRSEQMMDKVSLLLPTVVNKIKGVKLLPTEQTPEQEIILQFGKSLSPDQLEGMQKLLRPEQLMAVLELIGNAQKAVEEKAKKKEEEERKKEAQKNGAS